LGKIGDRHPIEEGRPTWPTLTTEQRMIEQIVVRSEVDEVDSSGVSWRWTG
jgi:hypothetical protein